MDRLGTEEVLDALITLAPSQAMPAKSPSGKWEYHDNPSALPTLLFLLVTQTFADVTLRAIDHRVKDHDMCNKLAAGVPAACEQHVMASGSDTAAHSTSDLLKAAVVLLKVIQLASSIDDAAATAPALQALWSTLTETQQAMIEKLPSKDQQPSRLSHADIVQQQQEMHMCLLVIRMLILVQKQLLKRLGGICNAHLAISFLLEDTLLQLYHQEVALEIVKQGKQASGYILIIPICVLCHHASQLSIV